MRYFKFIKETSFYFINYYLALFIVFIIKKLKIKWRNDIWLIGGNGGIYYSDNSAVLHQYILETYPSLQIYWVIDKSSPDLLKAKEKGPILYKHSLKANIYALLAEVLICSHSIRGDIMRANMNKFKNSLTVDLFHGITAFKAKNDYPNNDLIIATSQREKEIKQNWPNSLANKIVVTGFSRFDVLYKYKYKYEYSQETKKGNIFYMPTWRPWLQKNYIDPSKKDSERFKSSEFYSEVTSLLESKELNSFLQDENYSLNLFIHINLHPFVKDFISSNPNINILPTDTDIQKEMIRSDLLITDYSSVAWDFLFLDKPVIFYQFDYKVYKNHNTSYIDMEKELFGPITDNYRDTIKMIKKILDVNYEQDKTINKNVKKMKNDFIKYYDADNSKRIVEAILKRIN